MAHILQYKGLERYDKVEVNIPNSYTQNYINFPQNLAQLRSDGNYDIALQAIETWTQFSQATSQSNVTMPNVAQLIATRLLLYIDGEQSIFQVPLVQLNRSIAVDGSGNQVPYTRDLQEFDNLMISWEKCQLFNPAANGWNTGPTGSFSFEFGIHYLRLPPGTLSKLARIKKNALCNLPVLNGNG